MTLPGFDCRIKKNRNEKNRIQNVLKIWIWNKNKRIEIDKKSNINFYGTYKKWNGR